MSGCQVCGLPDDGYHFKALTCRACAAFFRRSIIKRAKYVCKFNGDCPMSKELRKTCAACRLVRCKDVGMDEKDVQWNRDANGPLKVPRSSDGIRPIKHQSSPSTESNTPPQSADAFAFPASSSSGYASAGSTSTSSSCASPNFYPTPSSYMQMSHQQSPPLLNQLLSYIQEYFRGERALYTMLYPDRCNGSMSFYPTTHTEMIAMERGCISLIQQMMSQMNPDIEKLPEDTKMMLLRSFYALFSPLLKVYLTATVFPTSGDKRFVPHYGQYTPQSLEFFKDDNDPKKSFELSEGIHKKANGTLEKLRALRLREVELAALCGLALANEIDLMFKRDLMSEYRAQIYRELHDDILASYPPFEAPNRFGTVICLLQDMLTISKEVEMAVIMCRLFSPHKVELNEIY